MVKQQTWTCTACGFVNSTDAFERLGEQKCKMCGTANGLKNQAGVKHQKAHLEMEKFAKDGYLAKQEFLARTDQRQAEVARSNRRRGMGLKD